MFGQYRERKEYFKQYIPLPLPGERAATLSLQTTGQRTGSVHPMEKLCSHFLLNPKTLQSERADKRDCGESAGGCKHRAKIDKHKLY